MGRGTRVEVGISIPDGVHHRANQGQRLITPTPGPAGKALVSTGIVSKSMGGGDQRSTDFPGDRYHTTDSAQGGTGNRDDNNSRKEVTLSRSLG